MQVYCGIILILAAVVIPLAYIEVVAVKFFRHNSVSFFQYASDMGFQSASMFIHSIALCFHMDFNQYSIVFELH